MSSPATRNIFQRIAAVMERVEYIKKEKSVSTGGEGSYKAVTHDQVAGMVRGEFQKNGIIVAPTLVEHTTSETGQKSNKGAAHVRLEVVYDVAFVNADSPDDRVVVRVLAHGIDAGDKAPGKVISYAVKYAILKILLIETRENDESRYGDGDDDEARMDPDELIKIEEAMKAATSRDELRKLLESAREACRAANDDWAARRVTKTAADLAEKLPEVKQPKPTKPAGGEPALKPDPAKKAPREAPSAGLLKSIRSVGYQRDLSEDDLIALAAAKVKGLLTLEDLDKAQAAAFLRSLSENAS